MNLQDLFSFVKMGKKHGYAYLFKIRIIIKYDRQVGPYRRTRFLHIASHFPP